jgi:protoporphyrinogen oxidase
MRVGVIGGGMLGLSMAYYLCQKGIDVTVFESKPKPGGLLDYFEVDGTWIDKYYHCILSADGDLLALAHEIGLTDQLNFAPVKQGVYRDGKLYPMASGKDFLLFPPLTLVERFRLGVTILRALLIKDMNQVESVGVEDWLVRLGGRGVFEKLWKPLLKAKFDSDYQLTPATYIWSRLKRTTSTNAATGKADMQGYFVGSYKVLVERLVERIEAASGSRIRCGARVDQVLTQDGRITGVAVEGENIELDAVVATVPLPVLEHMLSAPDAARLDLPPTTTFLGIVCGLLLLDRQLTPYYTLNITDDDVPFTGVIETTNMIAPRHVGGNHLVYLPKYVAPDSAYARLSDEELKALYAEHLGQMFPAFRASWIKHAFVFRERHVEPLHQIGKRRPTVPIRTPIEGMYIVNNGQIYPELTNCQSSVRHAQRAIPIVLEATPATQLPVTPVLVGVE